MKDTNKTFAPVLAIVALLFAGCDRDSHTATVENHPALIASEDAWEEAFNTANAEKGGALYTEDAIMMEPNKPSLHGRAAIAATFADPALKGMRLELSSKEAVTSGDLGYVYGTYVMTDPAGNKVDEGKYIETRRKVNGDWLIDRDIYNSDLPPPANVGHEQTKALVHAYVDVWNNRQFDRLAAIFSPTARRISPQGTSDATGPAGFQAVMTSFQQAFPDLKVEILREDYFEGGAALHWKASGTNTGPGENPPTGKSAAIEGLTIARVADGRITEEHVSYDLLDWNQQLGLLPPTP